MSINEIFDLTQDYSIRLEWDTFLKKAQLLDGCAVACKGARAYCVDHHGIGMETEYVSFFRPRRVAVKMSKKHPIFRSFLGSWNFREMESDLTEVKFLYAYELRFPFTLLSIFIDRKLRREVQRRLEDLKHFASHT